MAKSQPKSLLRTPLQSVVVFRDKKQVVPPIGQPFEFTAEEIEQIEAANPNAISDKITVAAETLQTMQEQAAENKSGETL